MIQEMHGWKVITADRHSTGGNFRIFATSYPKNELVVSSLARSSLFFFTKKEDANEYALHGRPSKFIVVPCIAYDCKKINFCALFTHDIEKFWKDKSGKRKISVQTVRTPFGAWAAKAIRCLE